MKLSESRMADICNDLYGPPSEPISLSLDRAALADPEPDPEEVDQLFELLHDFTGIRLRKDTALPLLKQHLEHAIYGGHETDMPERVSGFGLSLAAKDAKRRHVSDLIHGRTPADRQREVVEELYGRGSSGQHRNIIEELYGRA